MIGIQFQGRLGNQMFQYAAARCVAERLGHELVLLGPRPRGLAQKLLNPVQIDLLGVFPAVPASSLTLRLNRLQAISRSAYRRSLARHFPHRFEPRKIRIAGDLETEVYDPALWEIAPGTLLTGFFQSELYFSGQEAEIRRWFKPAPAVDKAVDALLAPVAGGLREYVAVHARLGDYSTHALRVGSAAYSYELGSDYYAQALARFPEASPIALFSDEPDRAATLLPRRPDWVCPDAGAIEKMLALSRFHNIVIANSSFSWWAAWLGGADNKVVAPRYHLGRTAGFWYPGSIEVANWTYV